MTLARLGLALRYHTVHDYRSGMRGKSQPRYPARLPQHATEQNRKVKASYPAVTLARLGLALRHHNRFCPNILTLLWWLGAGSTDLCAHLSIAQYSIVHTNTGTDLKRSTIISSYIKDVERQKLPSLFVVTSLGRPEMVPTGDPHGDS